MPETENRTRQECGDRIDELSNGRSQSVDNTAGLLGKILSQFACLHRFYELHIMREERVDVLLSETLSKTFYR